MIMIPYFVSKVEIHLYCFYTILSLVWIQVQGILSTRTVHNMIIKMIKRVLWIKQDLTLSIRQQIMKKRKMSSRSKKNLLWMTSVFYRYLCLAVEHLQCVIKQQCTYRISCFVSICNLRLGVLPLLLPRLGTCGLLYVFNGKPLSRKFILYSQFCSYCQRI